MKFRSIFVFELAYECRRLWTWLIFTTLLIFSFLFVRVNFIGDALYADHFVNSPFLVAGATVYGGLIWLLIAAVIAGEAAARDASTGMHPLVYAAPVGKLEYLGGRFSAAFVLNTLLLFAVQLGILLAIHAPGVHPDVVGPFRLATYLTAFGFIALPNAFVATSLQFAIALRSGRAMAGYLGSLFLIFMGFFVASILLFRSGLGSLLDPTGVRFISHDLAHMWTTIEQNTRLIGLQGTILQNRLLWIAVGVAVSALTLIQFRFAHRAEGRGWLRTRRRGTGYEPASAIPSVSDTAPISLTRTESAGSIPRKFGVRTHLRQLVSIASKSFWSIAKSWAGLALLVFVPLLTIAIVLDQMASSGAPQAPTTIRVIGELTGSISDEMSRWVIIPLFIIFFAGELVWREREAGVDEMTDTMPGSAWSPLLGKLLGLMLALVLFTTLQTAAGVAAQNILGHHDFQIALYLKVLFGLQLTEYFLFAILAVAIHVLVNQKYVGHLAAIVCYIFIALSSMFGVEHNLLIYTASPGWSWTEMRGFGPSLEPWLWFKAYWLAWAVVLAAATRVLWIRGKEQPLRLRLRAARHRLAPPTAVTAAVGVVLVLTLGGFIFYNTNILNDYLSSSGQKARQAEYERRYAQHRNIAQPALASAKLHAEIYPDRRELEIRGEYELVNRTDSPIDSIHVATPPGIELAHLNGAAGGASNIDDPGSRIAIGFDRPATPSVTDVELGYSTYDLERPLEPGQSIRLQFNTRVDPRGFRENGVDESLAANGTRFTSAWFPSIGYQPQRELMIASDRRAYGLEPEPLIPSLYSEAARTERGEPIRFEATVGTDAGQIAVAPGALRRSWTSGGRNYFEYATNRLGSEWGFYSARYEVHETSWRSEETGREVPIRIYHHPTHTRHLEYMVDAIHASLDYYTERFGPYEFGNLTVVESPGNGVGMHADASQLIYSEGFTTWIPESSSSLNMPFATVAHEMAHQWTVPYANVEGAPVMSESIAWYYAMQVVEKHLGEDQLHRLLRFMRQPYPIAPIRRGEPLLRGLDPYMSYRRGPFALHALSEYIGTDRVNTALRRLREKHEKVGAPLATTLDLYRELKTVTPEPMHYLLHDLFEVNTFWHLETAAATARQLASGEWQVTLDVGARKIAYDEAGAERDVPMEELIEIGVFGPGEDGRGELSKPLYLEKQMIRSGEQTITLTVPHEPLLAGIDPFHLLDWEEQGDDDNVERVTIKP